MPPARRRRYRALATALACTWRFRDPGLISMRIDDSLFPLRNEPCYKAIMAAPDFPRDGRTTGSSPAVAMTRKVSFPPAVAPDARLLILGSLPGERSLAEQRYYAHPQNQFWRLLAPVVGHDLPALDYDARLAALRAARIGVWDVVASATRHGSTDATIRNATANDLATLIAALPSLRAVAFNGGKALTLGRPLLGHADRLAIIALPSSSPLHTIGVAAKAPAWAALREWLGDEG